MGIFNFFKRNKKKIGSKDSEKKTGKKLPNWFEGKRYEKGSIVYNPRSGKSIRLNADELSLYDLIMGSKWLGENKGWNQNLKDNIFKGEKWFIDNNPKAYDILIKKIDVFDKNINESFDYSNIKWLKSEEDFKEIQSLNNLQFFLQYKMSMQGAYFQLEGDYGGGSIGFKWSEDYGLFNGGDTDGDDFDTTKKIFENKCFDTIFLFKINSDEFKQKLFQKIDEYKKENKEFNFIEFCESIDLAKNPDDAPAIFIDFILGKHSLESLFYEKKIDEFGNFISWSVWEQVYSEEFQLGLLIKK